MSAPAQLTPPRRRLALVRPPVRALAHGETATVVEHLEELRWRLICSIATLAVAFCGAYALAVYGPLLSLLDRPLQGHFRIVTLGVTEPFFTTVTVAAYAALAVAFPVLLYHAWRYASPAFTPERRRALRPYMLLAPVLFTCGVVFSYLFVLGPAVRFLLQVGGGHFHASVRAQDYYSFVSTTLLSMGLVFLFPLALVALAQVGIVKAAKLRSSRRYALLVIAILAAMLPTADPVSLMVEMAPLLVLYELSIWLVAVQERRLSRRV